MSITADVYLEYRGPDGFHPGSQTYGIFESGRTAELAMAASGGEFITLPHGLPADLTEFVTSCITEASYDVHNDFAYHTTLASLRARAAEPNVTELLEFVENIALLETAAAEDVRVLVVLH